VVDHFTSVVRHKSFFGPLDQVGQLLDPHNRPFFQWKNSRQ